MDPIISMRCPTSFFAIFGRDRDYEQSIFGLLLRSFRLFLFHRSCASIHMINTTVFSRHDPNRPIRLAFVWRFFFSFEDFNKRIVSLNVKIYSTLCSSVGSIDSYPDYSNEVKSTSTAFICWNIKCGLRYFGTILEFSAHRVPGPECYWSTLKLIDFHFISLFFCSRANALVISNMRVPCVLSISRS